MEKLLKIAKELKVISQIITIISRLITQRAKIAGDEILPALFDETDIGKRVEFETDTDYFNVYIKYCMSPRTAKIRNRSRISWDVSFTESEYNYLKKSFEIPGRRNYVALVLTNENLNDNYMAVIEFNDAMKCLEESTPGGSRWITVMRTGAEYNFSCYGVGFEEEDYIKCPVDCTSYLGLEESMV